MKIEALLRHIDNNFITGVPDSQLKELCNFVNNDWKCFNITAANEGNAVAAAAGYHLATGKTPIVYMQNSGIGNAMNPIISLISNKVYAIPCVFIIGWRGEPDIHDEPQHMFQGEITLDILHTLEIDTYIISKDTTEDDVKDQIEKWKTNLASGKSVAFIVKKNSLQYDKKCVYKNEYTMNREEVLRKITDVSKEDILVTTTGKTSRELFEIRERNKQSHKYDFLTVGSMGHCSSIAFGIALQKKKTKIWCIDGDGAAIMHMGSMAKIGSNKPSNLIHIVINNNSHESVGGMPTVGGQIDFVKIAQGCGYEYTISVDNYADLEIELNRVKKMNKLVFFEVKTAIGSRSNLGRPTKSPVENKEDFMQYLKECE